MATLPNFVDWDAVPRRALFPGVTIRVFSSAQVMLSLVEMEAGAVIPPHHHPHEQFGIWLEGEAEGTIGEERRTIRPGDCYYIPGDAQHSFQVGPAAARALDIFNPPREDYLQP